jgi:hypothetical protein
VSETTEGIETALALHFYSRVRLTMNLLPLLKASVSPRVISILVAGSESRIDPKDLTSVNKLPVSRAVEPAATMTSLIFEELANDNPTISFIHSYPGWVNTQIMDHLFASTPGMWWGLAQIPRFTVFPILNRFAFISADEAGERTLFLATSTRYPPSVDHETTRKFGGWVERPAGVCVARSTIMYEGKGNGAYRTDWNGKEQKESKILGALRKDGGGKAVLEHTLGVFEKATKRSGDDS